MVLEKLEGKFSKYEIARILGARALQVSMDAPLLLKINKEELEEVNFNPLRIAEKELESGVLPITVKKPFPKRAESEIKKKKTEVEEAEEKAEEKIEENLEEIEEKEEAKIKEDSEIMELAKPEDEKDEEAEENKREEI